MFCNDIDHAERMRRALVNLNPDQMANSDKYVMKITGDDELGKAQLDNFINPKKTYPVIATTSELMTTGVDAKTCKLIVLDQNIQSMTKFKQIIGRGTRIDDRYGKLYFTIMDFKKATELFADERFDGIPERVIEAGPDDIADPDFDINVPEEESDQFPLGKGEGGSGTEEEPVAYEVSGNNGTPVWDDGDEENRYIKYHFSFLIFNNLS